MLTRPDLSSLLLWLIDEPVCFVKCCQAEQLSWPSASGPEFWAVAWGDIIPRKFLPARLVPCPLVVAADGPIAALWPGSSLAQAGWHSTAALGPGKAPDTLPDALVLVTTKCCTSSTWVAGLGGGTARMGGGDGLLPGRRGIRGLVNGLCLFVPVVWSVQQVKFCMADGLVGGKGKWSMVM